MFSHGAATAVDSDGDGHDDATDKCPFTPNPDQLDRGGIGPTPDGIGDACQCGDVNGGGVVNVLDWVHLARAQALLAPPLTAPERCNVMGLGNPDDADMDGLSDDCHLNDALRIREVLAGVGPDLGTLCAYDCPVCGSALLDRAVEQLCGGFELVAADDALQMVLNLGAAAGNAAVGDTATVFHSLIRVVRPALELPYGPDPNSIDGPGDLLDALGYGVAGRDPLYWTASEPFDPNGRCIPPYGVHTSDGRRAVREVLVPELDAALTDLANVKDVDWQAYCQVGSFGLMPNVEIDYSDVLLMRAGMHALRALIRVLDGHDTDLDVGDLCDWNRSAFPGVPIVLADPNNSTLLTLVDLASLGQAEADLRQALILAERALDSIEAESDDQSDDVLSLDPNAFTPAKEDWLRQTIADILASLDGPVIHADASQLLCGDPSVHLGVYFDGIQIRDKLPEFPLVEPSPGARPDWTTVPDPTFGGLFPPEFLGSPCEPAGGKDRHLRSQRRGLPVRKRCRPEFHQRAP
jgi:hypothetical protein